MDLRDRYPIKWGTFAGFPSLQLVRIAPIPTALGPFSPPALPGGCGQLWAVPLCPQPPGTAGRATLPQPWCRSPCGSAPLPKGAGPGL